MKSLPTYAGQGGAREFADDLVKELAQGSQVSALSPAEARTVLAIRDALETFFKASDRLRRQGDFRNEHHGLPAHRKNLFNGADINLRLAAAGHAEEELNREGAGFDGGVDPRDGGGLVGRQLKFRLVTTIAGGRRRDRLKDGFDLKEPFFFERGQHGGGAVGGFAQIGGRDPTSRIGELREYSGLLGG